MNSTHKTPVTIADWMERSGVKFGTSGARGLVSAMTDEVCYAYATGFLQHLRHCGLLPEEGAVALAGDLRRSTPQILAALTRAVEDQGCIPIHCGRIPTPALALYALALRIPALMVTGSHIPDDRNGIKFYRPDGEILKGDEEAIRAQHVILPKGRFEPNGSLREPEGLPPEDHAAYRLYLDRYLGLYPRHILDRRRIGLYEHSSVAREVLGEILEGLGAEVVRLGRSDSFVPVDTEAIRGEDIRLARQWALEYGLDAIVSTDGDGDRPLVADESGNWLRGDVAGILCAQHLGARCVVTPVSSNSAVEKCGRFERVVRTRIGSPYVIEAMSAALAEGMHRVVGYEANGGFLVGDDLRGPSGGVGPLPTRDAAIVILAVLAAAERAPISSLLDSLPTRFTYSDRLQAFPTEESRRRLALLQSGDSAQDFAAIEGIFGHLCGRVTAIDITDGLRITFENEEVIHLRPSGNAPELRCYNEASGEVRGRELNRCCMEILEGWRTTNAA